MKVIHQILMENAVLSFRQGNVKKSLSEDSKKKFTLVPCQPIKVR